MNTFTRRIAPLTLAVGLAFGATACDGGEEGEGVDVDTEANEGEAVESATDEMESEMEDMESEMEDDGATEGED